MFFNEVPSGTTYKIDADGKPVVFLADSNQGDGQRFGADGKLYAVARKTSQVLRVRAGDATDHRSCGQVDGRGRWLPRERSGRPARWACLCDAPRLGRQGAEQDLAHHPDTGEKTVVDTGLKFSNGICFSPDQTLLYVADSRTHWVYSYQVQVDGALAYKQKIPHLHVPDTAEDSGVDGLRTDKDGRLWAATRLGLQVCDQAGRVNCMIPVPNGKLSNLTFGGPNFDTVYATCGDKVYKRKVKVGSGAPLAAHKPTAPRL